MMSPQNVIKIFSIEDHWAFIKGLSLFRKERDGLFLACSATNIDKALKKDPDIFDILLLDLMIPDTDPEENVYLLRSKFPDKPIIVLTSQENSLWELKMYRCGVKAFLTKSIGRKDLIKYIKDVYSGLDLGPKKIQELEKKTDLTSKQVWAEYLPPLEREIVHCLSKDMNVKEIASVVGKSTFTVYKIISNLRKGYKVRSNISLVHLFRDAQNKEQSGF